LDIYLTSVVIDDFHIYRTLIGPTETNSVLIIYADAVLPLAISSQNFQPVPRWRAQEVEGVRSIKHGEFPCRHVCNNCEPTRLAGLEESPSVAAAETSYHVGSL
jgi:hypothetical protein